jgi:oligopeptide/dipeptide ABC transporter ATP-binding protein
VLEIRDLSVEFDTRSGTVHAVDGVSFSVGDGEVLGLVGESGSGKSVTAQAILRLLPKNVTTVRGHIEFEGRSLLDLSEREIRGIRGREIGMVFQEPMSSLNPLLRVGYQIGESFTAHGEHISSREVRRKAVEGLRAVRIPNPEERYSDFPHQFSGGMVQRAGIAMAVANVPRLLIADEPTTALDVTVQKQVLLSLREAQQKTGAAMILITHNLGLIAQLADRVVVMYAGRIMESGRVMDIFDRPAHPYTAGLMKSIPKRGGRGGRLIPIPGNPPTVIGDMVGCPFAPRCDTAHGRKECTTQRPPLVAVGEGHESACHFSSEVRTP